MNISKIPGISFGGKMIYNGPVLILKENVDTNGEKRDECANNYLKEIGTLKKDVILTEEYSYIKEKGIKCRRVKGLSFDPKQIKEIDSRTFTIVSKDGTKIKLHYQNHGPNSFPSSSDENARLSTLMALQAYNTAVNTPLDVELNAGEILTLGRESE